MNKQVNIKQLNEVVDKTVQAMEEGKQEIFEISEKARTDCRTLEQELLETHKLIQLAIQCVDNLELKEKMSRVKLLNVSKNFNEFSEADIKKAYDSAKDFQVQLSLKRQEEKELFKKRSQLEIRLKDSGDVLKKAESLTSKVSMALELLKNSFAEQIEDLRFKQDMGLRIIQAQEAERKRLSREIHDGPAQAMANAVIKAEYCEKIVEKDVSEAKNEMKALRDEIRHSLRDIRKIIYDLLPMSLNDLGLIPTLERLIRDFEKETDIKVELTAVKDEELRMKQLIELTLFRLVQESLNNIRKHSKANAVEIQVGIRKDEAELRIKDNGSGFDLAQLTNRQEQDNGYGLYSMRERVDLLNGSIVLDSSPGRGTSIHVIIPLVDEEAEYAAQN